MTRPPLEGSNTHQALLQAAAAIEALAQGDGQEAAHCISRGYERIAVPVLAGGAREQLLRLIDTVYDADDGEAPYAAQLRADLQEKQV